MDNQHSRELRAAWFAATLPARRLSSEVAIGPTRIGGNRPVAVQTMTVRNTNDVEAFI